MSLMQNLQNLLTVNNKSWLAQVMNGAGLGLVSATSFISFIDYYKGKMIAETGNLGLVSGILGISGLDVGFSMVLSAIFSSIYIKQFASGLKVVKL